MKEFFGKYCFWLSLCFLATVLNITAATILDYDGDGKTDLVVARFDQSNPNFVWYILQSRDGFRADVWGLQSTDRPRFEGDYDGDGKTDIAVIRLLPDNPSLYWYILNSQNNTMTVLQWGLKHGDSPMPQDYDGDGKTDIAVFRGGWWYILHSGNSQFFAEKFGTGNDIPLAGGDYDGDGKADLTVIRYTHGQPGTAIPTTMYIRQSQNGHWAVYNLGDARFTGVLTGDYDGDGKADVAIWQGNLWLWARSSDNQLEGVRFGQIPGDRPVPGDYDGDGKTDPAVYRRSFPQSYFYILQSRDGFRVVPWGANDDVTDGSTGGTRYIPAIGF